MSYMDHSDPPPAPAYDFRWTVMPLYKFRPAAPDADLGRSPAYFHDEVVGSAMFRGPGPDEDTMVGTLLATSLHLTDQIDDEDDYTWPDPATYAGRDGCDPFAARAVRQLLHARGVRLRAAVGRAVGHSDGPRAAAVDRLHVITGTTVDHRHRDADVDLHLVASFLRTFFRLPVWDLVVLLPLARERDRWAEFGFVDLPGSKFLGWPMQRPVPSHRLVARRLALAGASS